MYSRTITTLLPIDVRLSSVRSPDESGSILRMFIRLAVDMAFIPVCFPLFL